MKKTIITLCAVLMAFALNSAKVIAQEYDAWRTRTWSVYLQGGASWAGGVAMKNIDASKGTSVSPLVGLGVDYNIRPWVRVGLNYEFSKFAREQRFSEFHPLPAKLDPALHLTELYGGTAFRNTWSHYHDVDLTAEFNVMEIWNKRKAKWFNLYLGTGLGGMFASGNSYDLAMGYELWSDPNNYQNSVQVGNNHEIYTWLSAKNTRHNFNSLYVPVLLSAEFDVSPRVTLGVKGSGKFLFSSDDFAPDNLWAAALVLRYNFLGPRQGYKSDKRKLKEAAVDYEKLWSMYRKEQADCNDDREKSAAAAAAQQARLQALEAENARLQQQLDRQREEKVPVAEEFCVQFRRNSARLSAKQEGRLMRYIETEKDSENRYIVIGESSAEGQSDFNQTLSERRLACVLEFLHANGIGDERIETAEAIGDRSQIHDPAARRVTVKVAQ